MTVAMACWLRAETRSSGVEAEVPRRVLVDKPSIVAGLTGPSGVVRREWFGCWLAA